jgi:predicted dehydrogenase
MTPDMPDPLRVAIIGYGLAGAVFHGPLVAATPGMAVAAIVTSNTERRAQVQRDFPSAAILSSAEEIWSQPSRYDLVVVAAANRAHVALGMAAIQAGLPVVIDKPIAASVADAERLISESKRAGVPLTVFQNRRWDGDFLTVRKLIAADLLGPVLRFESRFERYRPAPRPGAWRERPDPEDAGGLLYDLGSHLIDQALVLFGAPSRVYAEVQIRRPGAQVDDDTFVALQFPHGVDAHFWVNVVVRVLGPRIHISGLRGSYVKYGLDPQEPALRAGMRPADAGWGLEPPEAWGRLSTDVEGVHVDGPVETLPGTYEQFYLLLRDALTRGTPLPVDPQEAVTTLRVIEAARRSARDGVTVPLAEPVQSEA